MYYMKYYLPKQSKMFSDPQYFEVRTAKELANACFIAETCGYEIIETGRKFNGRRA